MANTVEKNNMSAYEFADACCKATVAFTSLKLTERALLAGRIAPSSVVGYATYVERLYYDRIHASSEIAEDFARFQWALVDAANELEDMGLGPITKLTRRVPRRRTLRVSA